MTIETIIVEGEIVYRQIDPYTYNMIQEHSTYKGVRYQRKDYAFKKRAEDISRFDRQEWFRMVQFFNHRCCKCESRVIGGIPTKDHIYGIRQGGSNSIRNLQPLCRECNRSKAGNVIDFRPDYCLKHGFELPAEWRLHA